VPRATDAFWQRMIAEANRFKPDLRRGVFAAIEAARLRLSEAQIVAYLRAGDIEGLVQAMLGPPDQLQYLYAQLDRAMHASVVASAGTILSDIPLAILNGIKMEVRLDRLPRRALDVLQQSQLTLIREIDTATRDGVRTFLMDGVRQGRNPRQTARELLGATAGDARIGGRLGLTASQQQIVDNYRRALETGSSNALQRKLRQRAADGVVQRARDAGVPLDPDRINSLVAYYERRMLTLRAETIARTESLRALREGRHLGWLAAIEQGFVDPNGLVKRWVTAHDERVRPAHQQMNGVEVPFDQPFEPEDTGPIDEPPVAVNCRCLAWVTLRRRVA
jgi:hypothetical protein